MFLSFAYLIISSSNLCLSSSSAVGRELERLFLAAGGGGWCCILSGVWGGVALRGGRYSPPPWADSLRLRGCLCLCVVVGWGEFGGEALRGGKGASPESAASEWAALLGTGVLLPVWLDWLVVGLGVFCLDVWDNLLVTGRASSSPVGERKKARKQRQSKQALISSSSNKNNSLHQI